MSIFKNISMQLFKLYLVPLLLFFALILFQNIAVAVELGSDISSDSEIELKEMVGYGLYKSKTIRITTRNGESTLQIIKDNSEFTTEIPFKQCDELWDYIIEKEANTLASVTESALPDTSTFTLSIRVDSVSHSFTAESIESLLDSRYRAIVGEIIRVAEIYSSEN